MSIVYREMTCTHPREDKEESIALLFDDGGGKNFIHQLRGGWGRVFHFIFFHGGALMEI